MKSEGIYYVVRLPDGWRLSVWRYAEEGDWDHLHWWESALAAEVAAAWSTTLGMPRDELAASLRPLYTGFPRGRISRRDARFAVLHGDNIQEYMNVTGSMIVDAFGIKGLADWTFDDHEQCIREDRDGIRKILGITENWKCFEGDDVEDGDSTSVKHFQKRLKKLGDDPPA